MISDVGRFSCGRAGQLRFWQFGTNFGVSVRKGSARDLHEFREFSGWEASTFRHWYRAPLSASHPRTGRAQSQQSGLWAKSQGDVFGTMLVKRRGERSLGTLARMSPWWWFRAWWSAVASLWGRRLARGTLGREATALRSPSRKRCASSVTSHTCTHTCFTSSTTWRAAQHSAHGNSYVHTAPWVFSRPTSPPPPGSQSEVGSAAASGAWCARRDATTLRSPSRKGRANPAQHRACQRTHARARHTRAPTGVSEILSCVASPSCHDRRRRTERPSIPMGSACGDGALAGFHSVGSTRARLQKCTGDQLRKASACRQRAPETS